MPDPTHRAAQSPDRRQSRRGALAENTGSSLSLPLVEVIGTIQRRLARPIESEDSNSCYLGNPKDAALHPCHLNSAVSAQGCSPVHPKPRAPRVRLQAVLPAKAQAFPCVGRRKPRSISCRLTPMSFSRWSSIAESAWEALRDALRPLKAPMPTRSILNGTHCARNWDFIADAIVGFSDVVAWIYDLPAKSRSWAVPLQDKDGSVPRGGFPADAPSEGASAEPVRIAAAEAGRRESAADQSRASRIRLNGVSKARRKRVKPALRNTPASRASPACAPSTIRPPSETAWAQQIVVEAA
jgi:hypothetical protein